MAQPEGQLAFDHRLIFSLLAAQWPGGQVSLLHYQCFLLSRLVINDIPKFKQSCQMVRQGLSVAAWCSSW
jgi:hypothetical protein